jgi:hypothetical protein
MSLFVCEEVTIAQIIAKSSWGISSAGRALHWQCRGKRFEPAMLHQIKFAKHVDISGFFIWYEDLISSSGVPKFANCCPFVVRCCFGTPIFEGVIFTTGVVFFTGVV